MLYCVMFVCMCADVSPAGVRGVPQYKVESDSVRSEMFTSQFFFQVCTEGEDS